MNSQHTHINSARAIKVAVVVSLIAAALVLSGCGSDNNDTAQLRIIHASADAPPVNVSVAGTTEASGLDYAMSSGFLTVGTGNRDIVVEAIIPSGNADVITVPGFNFVNNQQYTVMAVDNTAAIEALVVDDSVATPSASEVAISVVHASPLAAAATVDVYVTAPGVDLNTVTPNFTFSFKGIVDAGALPADSYQIRVTGPGSKTPVFDSGSVDLTPFSGQKLIIAAINSTNETMQTASPVKLLVANSDTSLVIQDVDTTVGARVVHLSPDAGTVASGPVEVFASSTALATSPTELIPAFEYTDIVPAADSYVQVPAGDYVFDVAPNTDSIGDSVFTSGSLSLVAGTEYSVIASGLVAVANAPESFGLLATADSNRSVVTQASVKVVHAAPAAGTVDVFVTPAGTFTTTDVENGAAGDPLLDDFEYARISEYVPVAPGDYDIRVVAGGTVAINVEGFTLPAGLVGTVIARQADGDGTPSDFNVVVLTN